MKDRMKWLVAAMVATMVSTAVPQAQAGLDGAQAGQLPSSALAYISLAGIDELEAGFRETGLWKAAEKMPMLPGLVEKGWADMTAEFEGEAGLPFQTVWDLLSGEMTFALLSLDLEAIKNEIPPPALFSLDLEGHSDAWGSLESKFLPMIDEGIKHNGGSRTESDYQGSTLHSFAMGGQTLAYLVVHQQKLVITNDKDALDAWFGGGTGSSLADSSSHSWVNSKLGKDNLGQLFVDLGAILQIVQPMLSAELGKDEGKIFDALSLQSLGGLGYSFAVINGGIIDRFALGFGPNPGGVVRILSELEIQPLASLALAPEDSALYTGSSLGNLGKLYISVRKLLEENLPAEAIAELDEGLAEFQKETGMSLVDDVLNHLSGEIGMSLSIPDLPAALIENPVAGLAKLNEAKLAFFLGLSDGAALVEKLEGKMAETGMSATPTDYKGVSLKLVPVPGSPVMPGYAVIGDTLVIALNETTLRASADLHSGGKGLEGSASYQKALSNLDLKSNTQIGYIDVPRILEVGGNLGLGYAKAAKARGEELPFDVDALPPLSEIVALIPPMISTSSLQSDGVVAEYHSPFGYLTQSFISTGAGAAESFMGGPAREPAPPEWDDSDSSDEDWDSKDPSDEDWDAADVSDEDFSESDSSSDEDSSESDVSTDSEMVSNTEDAPMVATSSSSASDESAPPSKPADPSAPVVPISPPSPPSGWTVQTSGDTMATYLSSDYQGTVSWLKTPYTPYMKLDSMIGQVKSSSGTVANFEVVSEGAVKMGGLEGIEMVYELGPKEARQRVRLLYLQDGTNLYTVSMQCSAGHCDSYQSVFDQILSAFK